MKKEVIYTYDSSKINSTKIEVLSIKNKVVTYRIKSTTEDYTSKNYKTKLYYDTLQKCPYFIPEKSCLMNVYLNQCEATATDRSVYKPLHDEIMNDFKELA